MGSDTHRVSRGSRRTLPSEIVHPPAQRAAATPEKTCTVLRFQNERTTRSDQAVNHSMVDNRDTSQTDEPLSVTNTDPGSSEDSRLRVPLETAIKDSKVARHTSRPSEDASLATHGGNSSSDARALNQQKVLPLLLPRLPPRGIAAKPTVTTRQPSILNSMTFDTANRIRSSAVMNPSWTTSTGETSHSSTVVVASDELDRPQQASPSVAESSSNILAPVTQTMIADPVKESQQSTTLTTSALRKRASSSKILDSPESHSTHNDLPLNVRNKKMKPTDCLLFAATLLEDAARLSPIISQEATVTETLKTQRPCPIEDNADPAQPRAVDVLCGRGGLINKHPGNQIYRRVVEYNKAFYSSVHKKHRILVSQSIVQSMLNFGCRFLTSGANDMKSWIEIDFKRAVQKTSQALREKPISQDGEEGDDDYAMKLMSESLQEDTCNSIHSQYRDFGNTHLRKGIASHEQRSRMDTDIQVG